MFMLFVGVFRRGVPSDYRSKRYRHAMESASTVDDDNESTQSAEGGAAGDEE